MTGDTLRQLADKDAIRDLIYTYCRAVDRIDVPLGHAIWHEGGTADYGADYYQGPGTGVIDLICRQHAGLLSHSHQVSNILIALDGDAAGSEAYMTGTMRMERDGTLMQITVHARYIDRWGRIGGRWGLLHRQVLFDHDEMRAVSAMGHRPGAARDRTDPSYKVLEFPA